MNFPKLFNDYRVAHNENINKGWSNVPCPFCNDSENKYHLGFSIKDNYCTCWKCGYHHIEDALSKLLNVQKRELPYILRRYETYTSDVNVQKLIHSETLTLPTDTFTEQERKYLAERNYDPDYLHNRFGVSGGGTSDRLWSYRIIIPMIIGGRIVSWTGRSILSKSVCERMNIPRYINLSNEKSLVDPKKHWLNIDNCNEKRVILVEGPMDCLRMGDNCLSGWGSNITEDQKLYIAKNFDEVMILFDNDETGYYKANKLVPELEALGIRCVVCNDELESLGVNDPGELDDFTAKKLSDKLMNI